MRLQPITCKLCGKQIPEGLPIVGEPPENARRRKVQNMTIHMQDKHPVSFQTALTTGMLCGQTIPAIMLAADFDLPDEMEQQRQTERARIAKLVRRVTLSDAQLAKLLAASLATEHIGDALYLLKDLRDRYEEIGAYDPTAATSIGSKSQPAPKTQDQSTPVVEASPQDSTPPPR